jgi:hypothetical protein
MLLHRPLKEASSSIHKRFRPFARFVAGFEWSFVPYKKLMADELKELQAEIAAVKVEIEACRDVEERKLLRKEKELLLKKELLLQGTRQGRMVLNALNFLFVLTASSVGNAPFGLGAF